jgi:hypothetical protein
MKITLPSHSSGRNNNLAKDPIPCEKLETFPFFGTFHAKWNRALLQNQFAKESAHAFAWQRAKVESK